MCQSKTLNFLAISLLACAQILVAQQQTPLTNKDVIDIVKIGLSEETVIAKIKASPCKFDTSVDALKELKEAGVPNPVIKAMIEAAPKEASVPTVTPSPTPAQAAVDTPLPTKNKRAWQSGIVRDTEKKGITTYGGTTTQGRVDDNGNVTANTNRSTWNVDRFTFIIEGEDYFYVVSHVLSFRWSKEAKVTVNAPVFYAIEGDKFYLLDEKDREFKLKIEKKILKEKK